MSRESDEEISQDETPVLIGSSDGLGVHSRALLGQLTAAERAHAYVQLNCFEWPDALAELKPNRWDDMSAEQRYRSDEGRELWKIVEEMTSPFERSQAWWLEKLGRTKEAHLEWWQTNALRTQRRRYATNPRSTEVTNMGAWCNRCGEEIEGIADKVSKL